MCKFKSLFGRKSMNRCSSQHEKIKFIRFRGQFTKESKTYNLHCYIMCEVIYLGIEKRF